MKPNWVIDRLVTSVLALAITAAFFGPGRWVPVRRWLMKCQARTLRPVG